jgi:hypothetical protein
LNGSLGNCAGISQGFKRDYEDLTSRAGDPLSEVSTALFFLRCGYAKSQIFTLDVGKASFRLGAAPEMLCPPGEYHFYNDHDVTSRFVAP